METIHRQDKLDQLMTERLRRPFAQVEHYFAHAALRGYADLDPTTPTDVDPRTISFLEGVATYARDLSGATHDLNAMSQQGSVKYDTMTDFRHWLQHSPYANDIMGGFHVRRPQILRAALDDYGRAVKADLQRVESLLPDMRHHYKDRLRELTKQRRLPPILLERLRAHKYADAVGLRMFDSSHQIGTSYGFEAGGDYLGPTHDIGFRPFQSEEEVFGIYAHEATHALSGTTTKRWRVDDFGPGKLYTARIGFQTSPVHENDTGGRKAGNTYMLRHRAINEGVTQYIAELIVDSGRESGIYIEERSIVSILAKRIGMDKILNAYAEDYEPGTPHTMWHMRQFVSKVSRIYGPGFLNGLDWVDRKFGPEEALREMVSTERNIAASARKRAVA